MKLVRNSSFHTRKAGPDTAFNHELHDLINDIHSDDSDDEIPETKNPYFEFSNGYQVMRAIRCITFIQILSLIIDHQGAQLPIIFNFFCRGLLRYSTTFYSRIFVDTIYTIQYFSHEISEAIAANRRQKTPTTPSNVQIETRRLNINPYLSASETPQEKPFVWTVDLLNDQYWWTLKHYSQYCLSILFATMSILFIIKFWEIHDYSNREEVRIWLSRYVADGWWRKGGANIAKTTAQACLVLTLFMFVLYAIPKNFAEQSIPGAVYISTIFALGLTMVSILWLIGYFFIRTTEKSFLRYVSQNVAYSSVIILKRAVKAKIDLGYLLALTLYMPAIYTVLQAALMYTDWNTLLAPDFRKEFNYFVPCYFLQFPPYREHEMSPKTCSVAGYSSQEQIDQKTDYYSDSSILQCDSYWGLTVYLISVVALVYIILTYFYMFQQMIFQVINEFKESRYVAVLDKLINIRKDELADYKSRFPLRQRLYIQLRYEVLYQLKSLRLSALFIVRVCLSIVKTILSSIYRPLRAAFSPFKFLLERLFILSCLNIKLKLTGKSRPKKAGRSVLSLSRSSVKSRRRTDRQSTRIDPRVTITDDEHTERSEDFNALSMSEKVSVRIKKLSKQMNPLYWIYKLLKRIAYFIYKKIMTSKLIVYVKVRYSLLAMQIMNYIRNGDSSDYGYDMARMGGRHAEWRKELTLGSKTRVVRKMKTHILNELRSSKLFFISDHELLISFFDCTLDSAGMFTLVIPYKYYCMSWFLLLLFEMTIYGIALAAFKQYTNWEDRCFFVAIIDAFFILLTYLVEPFAEEQDKWFEFAGRVMVFIIAIGLPIYADYNQDLVSSYSLRLYAPWNSFGTIESSLTEINVSVWILLDFLMTFYVYVYIGCVLESLGIFRMADRVMKSVVYSYHDHILDFLVNTLELKSFGYENVFVGLRFVQQWDDIIKMQRRYAMLTWPDVRPPSLASLWTKIFEIKWAALFNLTLTNIRSSLGITILHTAMLSAESEVARWIMHANKDLLHVPDSSNDTATTIALRECAYYLLVYGAHNEGNLEDGTAYSDEAYATYYPEVDDYRDEIFNLGEFLSEQSSTLILTEQDLIILREQGLYKEPEVEMDIEEELNTLKVYLKNNKRAKNRAEVQKRYDDLEKLLNTQKRREKVRLAKQHQEKASIHARRFPEDSLFDNFECGEISAWQIMRYNVPLDGVFVDPRITKKFQQAATYHYETGFNQEYHNNAAASVVDSSDIESAATNLASWENEKDLRYVVPAFKKVNDVDFQLQVPLDSNKLKEVPDFDRLRPGMKNRGGGGGRPSSSASGNRPGSRGAMSVKSEAQSVHSASNMFDFFGAKRQEKDENETSRKICRFAEILMSEEISNACKDFKWSIDDFKEFNKIASYKQGKIAQHLAMVSHLNPPRGFVRISDWAVPFHPDYFDEHPEENLSMIVKGVLTVVAKVENAAMAAANAIDAVSDFSIIKPVRPSSVSSKGGRGRNRFSRGTMVNNVSVSTAQRHEFNDDLISDRIVQYLAEAMVSSSKYLVLEDCELSHNGRRGFRALCRALRRQYCSFVLPSLYVAPKPIILISLELSRNEFDCGDCVYMSDVLLAQRQLEYIDLSFNRIGSRGAGRLAKALREHPRIAVIKFDHNNIGPGAGRDFGLLLKATASLRIFDLSFNKLGEITRFPTLYSREKIPSSAHDIMIGLKSNKSLEQLDLSYNHLGDTLAETLHLAVNHHPKLHTLNISGNDIGPEQGTKLLFLLAGNPKGIEYALEREAFLAIIKQRQSKQLQEQKKRMDWMNGVLVEEEVKEQEEASDDMSQGINVKVGASLIDDTDDDTSIASSISGAKQNRLTNELLAKKLQKALERQEKASLLSSAQGLTSLSIADNQLGSFAGHAIANIIDRLKGLTYLDISGNSLGPLGGERITDQLELMYGIKPRDFLKLVLWEIEESKYTGRNPKQRKKIFTNLTALNFRRNSLGPNVISSLMVTAGNKNCGIVKLDISDNPLGKAVSEMAGDPLKAALEVRNGLMSTRSLVDLNFNQTQYAPTDLITIFGGLAHHPALLKLSLADIQLDEPCCLQLGNVFEHCDTLRYVNFRNCRMGANGGLIIAMKINAFSTRLKYIDLTNNLIGPIAAIYLGEALRLEHCSFKTMLLAGNAFLEEGGCYIGKSLSGNVSVTDLDLSNNQLTEPAAMLLADAIRGLFKNGVKVKNSAVKRLLVNDNPLIGKKGAREIVRTASNDRIQHFEMRNIGAGPRACEIVASSLRDPIIAWVYLDVSGNEFSRSGLNQLFWAIRQNKQVRVLKVGDNKPGSKFCSNADALLSHGISVPVAIRTSAVLRELDLSFNSLRSEAGINIFDAIIDNHSLKKLSLRGNLLDDEVAAILPDFFKCNNVLEELDIGHNLMAFSCAFAISESLESNRSLKVLVMDYNRFGGAGSATLDNFSRSLMTNNTLQVINLDGNKLGPEWGVQLAETFARNKTLIQVSFRDNRLDNRAGKALLNAYRHAPYLVELAITADEIGVELWEQFRTIFHQKRASIDPITLWKETKITQSQTELLESYKFMDKEN